MRLRFSDRTYGRTAYVRLLISGVLVVLVRVDWMLAHAGSLPMGKAEQTRAVAP